MPQVAQRSKVPSAISGTVWAKMVALTTILTCITLSHAEPSIAKNMSKSRFLQSNGYRERPRMPSCPDGYIDRTNGQAYHWECGSACPVMHWSDSCCFCACVRPSDPLASQVACGLPAANAPKPTNQQPSNVVSFTGNAAAPAPQGGFAAPAPAPRVGGSDEDAGVPSYVVVILVIIGIGACFILCCALLLAGRGQPKLSRVTPDDIEKMAIPKNPAMPNLLQDPTVEKKVPSLPASRSPSPAPSKAPSQTPSPAPSKPPSNNVTPRSNVTAMTAVTQGTNVARAPQGTYLSTENLRSAASARSRSLSPRPNSETSFQAQDLASNRARSLSPRPY